MSNKFYVLINLLMWISGINSNFLILLFFKPKSKFKSKKGKLKKQNISKNTA